MNFPFNTSMFSKLVDGGGDRCQTVESQACLGNLEQVFTKEQRARQLRNKKIAEQRKMEASKARDVANKVIGHTGGGDIKRSERYPPTTGTSNILTTSQHARLTHNKKIAEQTRKYVLGMKTCKLDADNIFARFNTVADLKMEDLLNKSYDQLGESSGNDDRLNVVDELGILNSADDEEMLLLLNRSYNTMDDVAGTLFMSLL